VKCYRTAHNNRWRHPITIRNRFGRYTFDIDEWRLCVPRRTASPPTAHSSTTGPLHRRLPRRSRDPGTYFPAEHGPRMTASKPSTAPTNCYPMNRLRMRTRHHRRRVDTSQAERLDHRTFKRSRELSASGKPRWLPLTARDYSSRQVRTLESYAPTRVVQPLSTPTTTTSHTDVRPEPGHRAFRTRRRRTNRDGYQNVNFTSTRLIHSQRPGRRIIPPPADRSPIPLTRLFDGFQRCPPGTTE
jgi:hypothetical protein